MLCPTISSGELLPFGERPLWVVSGLFSSYQPNDRY